MTRLLVLAPLLLIFPFLMGAGSDSDLSYTPPPAPELPSVGPLLLRLTGATATALAVCGGAYWLARRGLRLPSATPAAGNRLRLLSSLPLGGGSFLFLVQAGRKQYVAGVGRLGVLQTLSPLDEDFEQVIDAVAGENAPEPPALLPFPTPPLPPANEG
jgi:flagellar biogenesis protein FliO